jgi:hypothetical protein
VGAIGRCARHEDLRNSLGPDETIVYVDEVPLGLRVDPSRDGLRLVPVEADTVHQLDQAGVAVVQPETRLDEATDLDGRFRQSRGGPGAQLIRLNAD